MTHIQQDGSDMAQKHGAVRVKRPISERKLQANRANAQRSTGPRKAKQPLQEINRHLEQTSEGHGLLNDCAQRPDGLQRSVHLICRYDRMLTKKMQARHQAFGALRRILKCGFCKTNPVKSFVCSASASTAYPGDNDLNSRCRVLPSIQVPESKEVM